jgi:hypothetical protein
MGMGCIFFFKKIDVIGQSLGSGGGFLENERKFV